MLSFLLRIFSDTESLLEYERLGDYAVIDFSRICNRLIAMVRLSDVTKGDNHYEGMAEMHLHQFRDISELMSKFACEWGNKVLCQERGRIYVKEERFEEWSKLITSVSPLWMVAGFIADKTDAEMLRDPFRINENLGVWLQQFQYTTLLIPFIPNLEYLVDKDGLNDLHIHLNGTTEIDILWLEMLKNPRLVVRDFSKVYEYESSVRKFSEQIIPGLTPAVLGERLLKAKKLRHELCGLVSKIFGYDDDINYSLDQELLLYVMVIKLLRKNSSISVASIFHHYLLIKGLVHRFAVMQHSQAGFSQFQLITSNSFRWGVEKYYKKRFKQLGGSNQKCFVKHIEGRFSPKNTIGENRKLIKRIISGFQQAVNECPDTLGHAQLSLIAHFVKKPETSKDKEREIRHYFLRKELKRKAISLILLIKKNPHSLGCIIKGVDAAASEFDAGPEVFAPIFRSIRKAGVEHVTFHAGEDFRYLLSGLRAIWEAMEFLDMKSGDRLGHCTALGVDPGMWQERAGEDVYLHRGEWLDDLVFVWYLINETRSSCLQPLILPLESEIAKLSLKVYSQTYQPFELANAWLLRKYSVFPELNTLAPNGSLDYYDSLEEVNKLKKRPEWSILEKYNQPLMYSGEGGVREPYGCRYKYDEIIKVTTNSLFDKESLRQIQMIILEKLADKNIILEALPTSNMHISIYDNVKEYHLKRWLDIEQRECLMPSVVLGSDDPGIFMTNIFNEFAMAYLHLGQNKFSIHKRMELIKYLKEYSEIYKFV